ncbi:MAG TPA: hypothetical protein VNM90_08725, partial [Haliangium sp.]|nr:hypothetical protein [Haliangium sp.]
LALGKEQLGRALVEPPREPGELVIVLSHHPLHGGWLADEKEAVSWLHNHAHIHLFGHIHSAESEAARGGTGASFVRIATGAVHEEKSLERPMGHGYAIGSVFAETSGALQLRLWPRLWSPRHAGFVVDVHNVPRGREHVEHSLGVTLPATDSNIREHGGNLAPTILPIADEPKRTTPSSSPLLQMIEDAFERKRRLEAVGLPVHDILAEIRQLKSPSTNP